MPTGTVAATGQTFTWTPSTAQASTAQSFTATITDALGNSTTLAVFVAVVGGEQRFRARPAGEHSDRFTGSRGLQRHDFGDAEFYRQHLGRTATSLLTATLMPQSNHVLQVVTDQGEMDFQLLSNDTPNTVAHIISLVNSGTYTNSTFYDIIRELHGGGGSGGTGGTSPTS